jgi:hypothetical protein
MADVTDLGPLTVYYDFKTAPITFDFVHFIAAASAYARLAHQSKFDLVLVADAFRNISPREKSYTLVERQWRVWNLTMEVVKIVPMIENVSIVRRSLTSFATLRYPPTYQPQRDTIIPYGIPVVKNFHDHGADVRVFRPSAYALAAAERLCPRNGRRLFTVTLRKAGFEAIRDSRLDDWYRFVKLLESQGHDVIVVPDQDDALGGRAINQYDWRVIDVASMSIDLRLALYTRADMNYVTNGGIIGIFLYSRVPFFWYAVAVEGSQVASDDFYRKQGIRRGGKYAWLGDGQEMVWEPDTYDNLVMSLDRIQFGDLPASATAS